jgi:hypothetical protein
MNDFLDFHPEAIKMAAALMAQSELDAEMPGMERRIADRLGDAREALLTLIENASEIVRIIDSADAVAYLNGPARRTIRTTHSTRMLADPTSIAIDALASATAEWTAATIVGRSK